MEATAGVDARERVTRWIEETRQLLALLPELLANDARNERALAAERESEKLRKELDDLRRENQQLRDDIAQAMAQVAQKLGLAPRKSPFERSPTNPPAPPGTVEPLRPAEPPRG